MSTFSKIVQTGVLLGGLAGAARAPDPSEPQQPGVVPEDTFDLVEEQERKRREDEAKGLADEEQRNASVAEEQARAAAQKSQEEADAANAKAQDEANEAAAKQQEETNAAIKKQQDDDAAAQAAKEEDVAGMQ